MRSTFSLLILILPFFGNGQPVEPLDSLIATIIINNRFDLQKQMTLLLSYKDKDALSLLPSIGYDLVTNRPLVHFSLNNYLTLRQRRKELQYQSVQLMLRYHAQLTTDTITCRIYYRQLTELWENYTGEKTVLTRSLQLLKIKTEENRQLQATSEEVLKLQLELKKGQLSLHQARLAILSKSLQISLLIQREFHFSFGD